MWLCVQLPHWRPTGLGVFLGVVSYWLLRFAVSLSLGAWFITTTRVSALLAAMSRMRLPRFLTIPLAVLFRFFPDAVSLLQSMCMNREPMRTTMHPKRPSAHTQ